MLIAGTYCNFGIFESICLLLLIVVEFNRLGFKEGRNYPNDMFWRIASELQLPAVIGIDAHDPLVYIDRECLERIKVHTAELGLNLVKPRITELG